MIKRQFFEGFTLIEIVISLAILAFGLVAVLSLFPLGFDSAARSADLTKAAIYAQYIMEDKKRIGFPVTPVTIDTAFPVISPPVFDAKFRYRVAVVPSPPAATDYYQTVTLTVTWPYRGKSYNEAFNAIIPRYSPPP